MAYDGTGRTVQTVWLARRGDRDAELSLWVGPRAGASESKMAERVRIREP